MVPPSPIGLGLLDAGLRFIEVNETFARLGGAEAEAHLGRRFEDVHAGAGRKVVRALRRLAAGEKQRASMTVSLPPSAGDGAHRAGHVWRISFHAERGADGGVRAVRAVAFDVTAARTFRARLRLERAFQELLIRLSCQFANLPAAQVDQQIEDGLRQLAEFLGVQRCVLAHLDRGGRLVIHHSYSVPTFTTMPRGVCVDEAFPWLAAKLRRGETVRISRPAELPPEAANERAWVETNGVHAHLSIPLSTHTVPLCVLAAASATERAWPDEFLPRLRLAGTIFADAVARQRADEDLQQTRDSLAHMVRVTTMGHLATSIAHEINQPLSAMVANAQAALRFMAAQTPDLAEATEALADIVRDGKRAGEVIARTHAMLKRHDVRFSPQDVNVLVNAIRPVAENYAMLRHVRVRSALAAGLPLVPGHGVQLQQVITNLLINAIDAIPAHPAGQGRVTVATEPCPDGPGVLVRVTDNGAGLPPGDVEQVFQPFFTSKTAGLGMGLNISRTIVEAHGGRLWAERNAEGGGATFRFTIPAG